MNEKKIRRLASKFLQGVATKEEEAALHNWYDKQSPQEEKIIIKTNGENAQNIKQRLFERIQSVIKKEVDVTINQKGSRRTRLPYAAAIFFFFSLGALYLYVGGPLENEIHYTKLLENDVGPGGNNAILELQNGEKINLDDTLVGDIVNLNGMTVNKTADGVLSIDVSDSSAKNQQQYNTIRTPKGGQYQLKLPDGTRVWLNASSSIRFPTVFSNNLREVHLDGEAYFEVRPFQNNKNQRIPFMVTTHQQQIEVLGTSFNVNSYSNEKADCTTLLEGSVRVLPTGSSSAMLLQPGQQSTVQQGLVDIQQADTESAFAWKNGDFVFNHENLFSIMKKIERWYDVEVVYQNVKDDRTFSGAIPRSRNLSEVLQLMEMAGQVSFKIEGRRVFVMT